MKKIKLSIAVLTLSLLMPAIPIVFADPVIYDNVIVCKSFYPDTQTTTGLQLNTYYEWTIKIAITNLNAYPITDIRLSDRFGAEFGVTIDNYYNDGNSGQAPTTYTIGNSDKVFLNWYIGTLPAGGSATVILTVYTDLNPAGKQEFTSPGCYYLNSGAVFKWYDDMGVQQSANTGQLVLSTIS